MIILQNKIIASRWSLMLFYVRKHSWKLKFFGFHISIIQIIKFEYWEIWIYEMYLHKLLLAGENLAVLHEHNIEVWIKAHTCIPENRFCSYLDKCVLLNLDLCPLITFFIVHCWSINFALFFKFCFTLLIAKQSTATKFLTGKSHSRSSQSQ